MNNFFVIANTEKDYAMQTADKVEEFLQDRGLSCRRADSTKKKRVQKITGLEPHFTDAGQIPDNTDCIIVLGGDGTLLQAARDTAGKDIPLLGINNGHLGYLSQVSDDDAVFPALERLINDDYRIDRRMLLDGAVYSGKKMIKRDISMNDVILSRGGTNPMHFRVYVDDQALGEYAGDGIVVATPTGSTAYSLSAGGPILDPATRMIVLTPVCAHIIGSRSIVISHRSIVKIVIDPEYAGTQSVSFDGGEAIAVKPGDHIVITESVLTAPLIELERMSFLERLRRKMQMI